MNINNEQPSSWLEHAYSLADRLQTVCSIRDIMDSQAGEHNIERVISEWQASHIGSTQFNSLCNPFQLSVSQCGFGRIARLILGLPQIHAIYLTLRQKTSSHQKNRTTPTSQI